MNTTVVACLYFLFILFLHLPLYCLAQTSPNINTFAFNNQRTAAIYSGLNGQNFKGFKASSFPAGQKATKSMPLYYDGAQAKDGPLKGKKAIFFGTNDGGFVAHDLVSNRTLWEHRFEHGRPFSTPVMDEEGGRIYVLTQKAIPHTEPSLPSLKEHYTYTLHSLDFGGRKLDEKTVDVGQILQEGHSSKFPVNPSAIMLCRTALTLQKLEDRQNLIFGCSIKTDFNQKTFNNLLYGQGRGIRGILVSVPLDQNGKFETKRPMSLFYPSKLTSNPLTGYDTGVYLSGSGVALLPDQSVLVATGNGPFIPTEENYGCSVVRLNAETLRPDKRADAGPTYYSMDDSGYSECYFTNNDLSSSAVAIMKNGIQLKGAIVGKDGVLRVFDPLSLPGDSPNLKKEVKFANRAAYGGPAFLADSAKKLQMIFSYQNEPFGSSSLFKEILGHLKAEGDGNQKCIGLLSKVPIKGGTPLTMYYSGKTRDDHVLVPQNSELEKRISSPFSPKGPLHERFVRKNWGIYLPSGKKVHAFAPTFSAIPQGFKLVPLETFKILLEHPGQVAAVFIGLVSGTKQALDNMINEHPILKRLSGLKLEKLPFEGGHMLVSQSADGNGYCGDLKGDQFERLSLSIQLNLSEENWGLTSWTVNGKDELEQKWIYRGRPGYAPHRITPLVTLPSPHHSGLAIITGERKNPIPNDPEGSLLIVLDQQTGKLLQELPFSGTPHFSMPVIIDGRLFLPTQDRGILLFEHGEPHLPK